MARVDPTDKTTNGKTHKAIQRNGAVFLTVFDDNNNAIIDEVPFQPNRELGTVGNIIAFTNKNDWANERALLGINPPYYGDD